MELHCSIARVAGAVAVAGLLAACSDSPTAPATPAFVPAPLFALGDTPTFRPTADIGKIVLCKTGDLGGTFNLALTTEGSTIVGSALYNDDPGTPAHTSTVVVAAGTCREIATDLSPSGNGSHVTITEVDQANVIQSVDACFFRGYDITGTIKQAEAACSYQDGGDLFINSFHGFTIIYRNTDNPPPPPDVCDFSTFGGYVLLPNNISYGGNAGRISDPPGFAYGSLNFKNHTNGDHIHVWNVTDYGHPDDGPLSQYEDSRLAYGLASVNGGPVNVPVEWRFVDLGEPAKKLGDAVYLKVGNTVLIPEQVVIGGNIQLHAKCKKAPKAEKH